MRGSFYGLDCTVCNTLNNLLHIFCLLHDGFVIEDVYKRFFNLQSDSKDVAVIGII